MGSSMVMMAVISTMMAVMPCTCYPITSNNYRQEQLYPVVLVPGAGGNQLEARLTKEYKATSWLCNKFYPLKKDGGWFRLWFDVGILLAPLTECFAERMTLYYDEELDDYRNAPGVETRVSKFGSTESLLYLDPSLNKSYEF
uniref:Lecithin-cholesterol acyltransferase-like 1 n=1 Tax=Tanacetum cinerariifolium TaxID=118510 RepID=A0A699H9U5_TANCI|nr:lecithin-cholesterol acyltransferase-like 1 [Tanacetum cinerariifolium]